jgi:hypothetical protein
MLGGAVANQHLPGAAVLTSNLICDLVFFNYRHMYVLEGNWPSDNACNYFSRDVSSDSSPIAVYLVMKA